MVTYVNAISTPCQQAGTAQLLPIGLVPVLVGRERSPGPTWKSANWRRLENPLYSYLKRGFNGNTAETLNLSLSCATWKVALIYAEFYSLH